MSKISSFIRSTILAAVVVIASFMCGLKLLQIQIADGGKYLAMTQSTRTVTQDIEAARGKIADSSGNILNTNKIVYTVNLQSSSLEAGTENDIIYRVLTVLIENGEEWNESIPITKTAPYEFTDDESAVSTLKSKLNVGGYATVDNVMYQLYKTYEIGEEYDEQMRRYIAGVRYEMQIKDFSLRNKFVLASGISEDTVHELKELSALLSGVDITESWEREYLDGDLAPHIRGTVGAISADKYAELQSSGYTLNDVIGLSGVEQALEDELRGTRGVRTITCDSDGVELSDEVTTEPQAGNSVMLTIDSNFQRMVQEIVQYHMDFLHSPYYTTAHDAQHRGTECYAGAAVVLDVKTGGVLACVSLPGYDLNDYVENYSEVLNRDYSPVFNRALNGTYRPGSTFKTITATAGLAEGVITPSTLITCNQVYTYYSPWEPTCTGYHGAIPVDEGLHYSCNIFFYETARLLGIERLASWAYRFGVGQDLGFELSMATGQMTSLELYDELNLEWNEGNVIQAGIGQMETALTPMHLAVQAMTIANKGVRYEPHIVKAVYNYDFTELIYEKEPVVAEDMSEGMEEIFETVTEGMKKVSTNANFLLGDTWANVYDYVGVGKENVATKTGTPQTSLTVYNSAVIGFYPADDPEIAFGIVMEKAEFSRHIAANIISAYVTGEFNPHYDEEGYATLGV
jgi:penicillin-binding protein 2